MVEKKMKRATETERKRKKTAGHLIITNIHIAQLIDIDRDCCKIRHHHHHHWNRSQAETKYLKILIEAYVCVRFWKSH